VISINTDVCSVIRRAASSIRPRLHQQVFVSKIGGDQIIRTPTPADVHPGSGGAYQITVGIERFQETRFIGMSIRLNSPQRAFIYKK
jgi:hypothetical protein